MSMSDVQNLYKTHTLRLPMPPSANVYWRLGKHGLYVSDEAKQYKQEVWILAREYGIYDPLEGAVIVTAKVYRPRKAGDLDNRLKVLLDALQGTAYHNDKQIVEIHAYLLESPNDGYVVVDIASN